MKKFLMIFAFSAVLLGTAIAEPKNKIGVTFPMPVGINYSRQVSDLTELDLIVGFYDPFSGPAFELRVSPLFKLWNGPVGAVSGKFSLGPGFGFMITSRKNGNDKTVIGGFNISLPLRFEFQFKIPFNLYLEATPIGVGTVMYTEKTYNDNFFRCIWYYDWGAALGLRYSF